MLSTDHSKTSAPNQGPPVPMETAGAGNSIPSAIVIHKNNEIFSTNCQLLAHLIKRLEVELAQPGTKSVLEEVLCDLAEYLAGHFSQEEFLMDRHQYFDACRHKEEHVEFIACLTRLVTGYEIAGAEVIVEILHFLKDWMADHVLGADRRFEHFLRSLGRVGHDRRLPRANPVAAASLSTG